MCMTVATTPIALGTSGLTQLEADQIEIDPTADQLALAGAREGYVNLVSDENIDQEGAGEVLKHAAFDALGRALGLEVRGLEDSLNGKKERVCAPGMARFFAPDLTGIPETQIVHNFTGEGVAHIQVVGAKLLSVYEYQSQYSDDTQHSQWQLVGARRMQSHENPYLDPRYLANASQVDSGKPLKFVHGDAEVTITNRQAFERFLNTNAIVLIPFVHASSERHTKAQRTRMANVISNAELNNEELTIREVITNPRRLRRMRGGFAQASFDKLYTALYNYLKQHSRKFGITLTTLNEPEKISNVLAYVVRELQK